MVSLNSSHHWILQGFETNDNRWGRVDPEGQETLRFGHEGAKVSGVCVGELLGAFLGMKKSLSW